MDTELAIKKLDDKMNMLLDMMRKIKSEIQEDESDYLTEEDIAIIEQGRQDYREGKCCTTEDIMRDRLKNGLGVW